MTVGVAAAAVGRRAGADEGDSNGSRQRGRRRLSPCQQQLRLILLLGLTRGGETRNAGGSCLNYCQLQPRSSVTTTHCSVIFCRGSQFEVFPVSHVGRIVVRKFGRG